MWVFRRPELKENMAVLLYFADCPGTVNRYFHTMPNLKDFFRSTRIMAAAGTGILLLLLASVVASWHYNLSHGGWWFVRSTVFLVVSLALVWRLSVHIQNHWLRFLVAFVAVEGLVIFTAARVMSFYLQGESFNEEFFFHANMQTFEFGLNAFPGMVALAVGYLVVVGLLAYFFTAEAHKVELQDKTLLIVPGLLLSLAVDPDITSGASFLMRNANIQNDMALADIDWEATGLNEASLYRIAEDITAGKNVVMIYMESMEKMYTDESVYPGLTPFLNSLADEALSFENIYQTQGTNFTVAGIVSSQCGTPLLIPPGPGGNDILRNGFLQEAVCFGDILSRAGYRQVFMGGASTRFAGKGMFLAAHGYQEVLGLEELRPLMDDPDYLNRWGLYDETLLDLAEDKFDELAANTQKPFNFTVLTVDAHPPDGTPSEVCKPYDRIDNMIFHAVHCTDQMVEKFVNHLKQSPAWDDTVIFLMSDHLHMRNIGQEYYPENYERKIFVNILNAGVTGKIDKQGTHMDLAPTLLTLMGVSHQQAFLAGSTLLEPGGKFNFTEREFSERFAAIRYINTNLLSQIETPLCEANPLYSHVQDSQLRIAGKEVNLTQRGRPMSMERIGESHALFTLVSTEGKVGLSFPVNLSHLEYELFQFRDNSFFILTPAAGIRRIYPDLPDYNGLGVLFGNIRDGFELLAADLSFDDGFTINADCKGLLRQARDYRSDGLEYKLGEICENQVPDGNVWRDSEGSLSLSTIAYSGERFQADFRRNSRGWYTVTAYQPLEPIAPEGVCDAFYQSQEILIPGVQSENGPVSLILNKIPGITLTFELGPATPLP